MRRDGASPSLWQDTTENYRINSQVPISDTLFDVIIAGGGITGITTGLLLQKAGKSVLIAEAQTVGFGTTGGTTAHLNTSVDSPYHEVQKKFGEKNAQLLARAISEGLALVEKNIKECDIDCGYKKLDGFLFSQDDDQTKELEDILKGTLEAGVAAEWSDTIPVPIPFDKAIRFPGQATFHPTRYTSAIARAFEKAGGVILQQCRVTGVEEGNPHTVETSYGNFKAHHFIYATHIPPGVNLLHFRCAPYRSYVIAAKLKREEDYPDALAYDMQDPYHYYRTQEIDGELYFIAGGEDHKTGHEENTEGCLRRLEAYLRQHFNIDSIVNKWSSQYFEPADGLPYIGNLPAHPENMYVATGYGGNGMTFSSVAAITLTDIIVKGESEYQELFDPNRIKMVAGFSKFVKESADVAGKFIKKILPAEKLKELADLARGEGKVVNFEGQKVAIYKDDTGQIYALNSACKHIKCDVAWNGTEKSWDCPCHGSRYSYTGEMITAPARKDLDVIEVKEEARVSH